MNNKKPLTSFRELDCWKKAREIRLFIEREIIIKIPKKDYDLIDNIRRASRSGTRNIAEGYGRFHHKENIQFCRISRGSMYEMIDDIITCFDHNYIDKALSQKTKDLIEEGIHILNGYIKYLKTASEKS